MAKEQNWIDSETEKLEAEKVDRMKALGYEQNEYVKLDLGENIVELDLAKKPARVTTKYNKERLLWKSTEGKVLAVSTVLHSDILKKIVAAKAQNNPSFKLNIIKTGAGADTRYSLK